MTLYDELVHRTQADVDRRGEAHLACPVCGKESSPRNPHCSFSERGWKCFVCGSGGSLRDLAKRLQVETHAEMPLYANRKAAKPVRTNVPYWATFESAQRLLERFENHPHRISLWRSYKCLSEEMIERHRLGVGVLPASRCKHERLIVPVFAGTMLVGLRGRSLSCDCGKWLQSGGTTLDRLPLYNDQALEQGGVVWIVENPIDALMISERTPYTGLATYSISYWREAWTETLKAAQPELVVIAFDNDLPGQGGGVNRERMVREWLRTHPMVPEPRGPKLANTLIKAGLPAVLYDWPAGTPNKFDIGSLLAAGA